jgi:hypothetical protein
MSAEQLPADSHGKMVVFGAKEIRRIWHEEQWFFSVVDIIAVLTDSDAPSKYWTAMKRREEKASGFQLSTICRRLSLTSSDEKSYKTDCVNVLGEAATTEIARNKDAQGFVTNKRAAQEGGTVAGSARRQLEAKSGRKVVTRQNYLADKPAPKPKLPPKSE